MRGAPVFENAQLANLHRLWTSSWTAPRAGQKLGLPTTHEELDAFLPQLTPSDPYGPDVEAQFGDPSRGNTIITHPLMVNAFGAVFDGGPMPAGLAEEVSGHVQGLRRRLPMADLSIDAASLGASVVELEATVRSYLAGWDAHLNHAGPPERFSALPDERTRDERTRLFTRNAAHLAKGDAQPEPDPFEGRSPRDIAAALLSPMGVNQMAKTVAELWYQFIDADLLSIGNADHDLRRLLHQLPGHSAVILDTWTDMIGPVDTARLDAVRRVQTFESGFIDFLRGVEDDGSADGHVSTRRSPPAPPSGCCPRWANPYHRWTCWPGWSTTTSTAAARPPPCRRRIPCPSAIPRARSSKRWRSPRRTSRWPGRCREAGRRRREFVAAAATPSARSRTG
ncbi:hypothetical protein ACU686_18110 [Yinghuangia aomiensis]